MKNKMIVILVVELFIILALGYIAFNKPKDAKCDTCPNCSSDNVKRTFQCVKVIEEENEEPVFKNTLTMTVDYKGVIEKNIHTVEYQYYSKDLYTTGKEEGEFDTDTIFDDEKMLIITSKEIVSEENNPSVYYYTEKSLLSDGYECTDISQ